MNRSLRIAVADDEALIRQYFSEILRDMGHEVVAAARDGRELVEACRRQRPDLVISDIKMPRMDGIEAAATITGEQSVPVILVSAFHEAELVQRAGQSHVYAYLVKPIERADLETAITIAVRQFEQFESLRREASDLRQALDDRKIIERAKGIVMKKLALDEDAAFRRLQKAASDQNKKLADVAGIIVDAEAALGDIAGK